MSIFAAAPILMPVWQQNPMVPNGAYTVTRLGSFSSIGDINAYQNQNQMQSYSELGIEYLPDFSVEDSSGFAYRDSGVDVLREARMRYWNSLTDEERFQESLKSYEAFEAKRMKKSAASSQSSESVGIRGAVPVPAASSYTDSKSQLSELVSNQGEFAEVAKASNIDLCPFLSDLPDLGIDLSAPQLGIPALQEFMAKVNGVGEKALGFLTGTWNPFGGKSVFEQGLEGIQYFSDLATAIQQSIPTITCGGSQPLQPIAASPIGTALYPQVISPPPVPSISQIGISPIINVSSPDVTVQSLNDVLDAGEI